MSYFEPPLLRNLAVERRLPADEARVLRSPIVSHTLATAYGLFKAAGEITPNAIIKDAGLAAAALATNLPLWDVKPEYALIDNLQKLLEKNRELREATAVAWERKDFTNINSLAFLHPDPMPPALEYKSHRSTVQDSGVQSIALNLAWSYDYVGTLHQSLYAKINAAFRIKQPFCNQAQVIQGTGSGKSRMVQELAELVFSIPFNLRFEDAWNGRTFPGPDGCIRDHLIAASDNLTSQAQKSFYLRFFCVLFKSLIDQLTHVLAQLKEVNGKTTYAAIASSWRSVLDGTRHDFYLAIVANHMQEFPPYHGNDPHVLQIEYLSVQSDVRDALSRFIGIMDEAVTGSEKKKYADRVKIVCSMDEVDILARTEAASSKENKTLYDVLCSCSEIFSGQPIFFLFLSTHSQLSLLAPPKRLMTCASTRSHFATLVPPITETPFDCSPEFPLRLDGHTMETICRIESIARFGRPLFMALLRASDSALLRDQIIPLARAKLMACGEVPEVPKPDSNSNVIAAYKDFYTPIRKMVLADVRLALNFEPGREAVRDELQTMIASHMRTVYSVPRHRDYFRSAYPSEPLLAESAAHELRALTKSGVSSLPNILTEALANDLCSLGERGEVVGRALLTMAYDRAVEHDHHISSLPPTISGEVIYSKGCSVVTFIEELFSSEHAQKILACCPDNTTGVPFREVFKSARLRFTHFARLGDNGGITPPALFAAFLRGHAQMCHTTQTKIDVVIPMLLDEGALCVEHMSGILVSFKRRIVAGSLVKYEISADKLQIFEPWAGHLKDRPYIALVMELGVGGLTRYSPGPTNVARPVEKALGKSVTLPKPNATPVTPSKTIIGQLGKRRKVPGAHPRYNIYAYGCSNSIYKVISQEDRDIFHYLLANHDIFEEHPRGDFIGEVMRQQAIVYSNADCFHWITFKDVLENIQKMQDVTEEAAMDGVLAGSWETIEGDAGDGPTAPTEQDDVFN
ncbi:hypothetical protein OBBRIDRAFT_891177 [Obba rivulosa]|uniref:Uncharacterized protein n=1 Tax=Obba rivulosa TaxID=1052685 RepID=A0A8E2AJP0_9APHY|nr:hypothetical protein OBBRIDRAFT_891177 [Obba rivulosa]